MSEQSGGDDRRWLDRALAADSPWLVRVAAALVAAVAVSCLAAFSVLAGLLGGLAVGMLELAPLVVLLVLTARAYEKYGVVAAWGSLALLIAWLAWRLRKL